MGALDHSTLTDEEFLNLGDAAFAVAEDESQGDEIPKEPGEAGDEGGADAGDSSTENENTSDNDDQDSQEPEEKLPEEVDDSSDDADNEDPEEDVDSDKEPPAASWEDVLSKPFKAANRQMQVESPEEALRLMQMGVGYNIKMEQLKPHLKTIKFLEKHDLLGEDKLGFLVDLNAKDPKAIAKLLKDSEMHPMDVQPETADDYVPTANTVNDSEIELDLILQEIKESPNYSKVLDVVGNKWDAASQQFVAEAPQLLQIVESHMANGIYDLISKKVERERLFGGLQGMSDLEAYQHVGDQMDQAGAFNHLNATPDSDSQAKPAEETPKPSAKEKTLDPALRHKKMVAGASPSKSSKTPANNTDSSRQDLSDEEFLKQFS